VREGGRATQRRTLILRSEKGALGVRKRTVPTKEHLALLSPLRTTGPWKGKVGTKGRVASV